LFRGEINNKITNIEIGYISFAHKASKFEEMQVARVIEKTLLKRGITAIIKVK